MVIYDERLMGQTGINEDGPRTYEDKLREIREIRAAIRVHYDAHVTDFETDLEARRRRHPDGRWEN